MTEHNLANCLTRLNHEIKQVAQWIDSPNTNLRRESNNLYRIADCIMSMKYIFVEGRTDEEYHANIEELIRRNTKNEYEYPKSGKSVPYCCESPELRWTRAVFCSSCRRLYSIDKQEKLSRRISCCGKNTSNSSGCSDVGSKLRDGRRGGGRRRDLTANAGSNENLDRSNESGADRLGSATVVYPLTASADQSISECSRTERTDKRRNAVELGRQSQLVVNPKDRGSTGRNSDPCVERLGLDSIPKKIDHTKLTCLAGTLRTVDAYKEDADDTSDDGSETDDVGLYLTKTVNEFDGPESFLRKLYEDPSCGASSILESINTLYQEMLGLFNTDNADGSSISKICGMLDYIRAQTSEEDLVKAAISVIRIGVYAESIYSLVVRGNLVNQVMGALLLFTEIESPERMKRKSQNYPRSDDTASLEKVKELYISLKEMITKRYVPNDSRQS
eukprot:GHVU01219735.1.p5 GENE.GHVU01219735.1~~GHVU01219735.1.p5  ORF type:complete len:447 (+),score=25.32 GHVU01219735.1:4633-5973(+)